MSTRSHPTRTLLLAALSLSASYAFMHLPTFISTRQHHQQQQNAAASSSTKLFHNNKKKKITPAKGFGGGTAASAASSRGNLNTVKQDTFPYSGTVRPGQQSPQRVVLEEGIAKPDYWKTGIPSRTTKPMLPWIVEVKSPEAIEKMRAAGKLARHVLDMAGRAVVPGVTTDEIDRLVHEEIVKVSLFFLCGKNLGPCFVIAVAQILFP